MSEFKENGLKAAKSAGLSTPTLDQVFWFGLYEGAKQSPLRTTDAEAEDLFRFAFYTPGPEAATIDPEAVDYVARQVRASLKDHVYDSTEAFDQWIKDPKSNLTSRIVKRKDCRWTRNEIRRAIFELGWRSFQMLAKCIDACMRSFAAVLPAFPSRAVGVCGGHAEPGPSPERDGRRVVHQFVADLPTASLAIPSDWPTSFTTIRTWRDTPRLQPVLTGR